MRIFIKRQWNYFKECKQGSYKTMSFFHSYILNPDLEVDMVTVNVILSIINSDIEFSNEENDREESIEKESNKKWNNNLIYA